MKTNTFKSVMAVLMALFSFNSTYAYDVEIDGIYYNLYSSEEVKCAGVTKGERNYEGKVVIPESVKKDGITYSVMFVDKEAFSGCSDLTSVTFPNSVISIGWRAFHGCSGLTSVTIGENVEKIEESAFYDCKNIKDVYCFAKEVPETDELAFASVKFIEEDSSEASIAARKAAESSSVATLLCRKRLLRHIRRLHHGTISGRLLH